MVIHSFLLFVSCERKQSNKDITGLGSLFVEYLRLKDSVILKQIINFDSLDLNDSINNELRKDFKIFTDTFNIKNYTILKIDSSKSVFYSLIRFDEWKRIRLLLGWHEDFIDAGLKPFKQMKGDFARIILKNKDNRVYLIELELNHLHNKFNIKQINYHCLSDECEHTPQYELKYPNFQWTMADKNTFEKASLIIKNATNTDIEYIKLRLKLSLLKSDTSYLFESDEFFNKTLEINAKIYKGDLYTFDIEQLRNYYAGSRYERKLLTMEVSTIEIRPKLNNIACEIINNSNNATK